MMTQFLETMECWPFDFITLFDVFTVVCASTSCSGVRENSLSALSNPSGEANPKTSFASSFKKSFDSFQ